MKRLPKSLSAFGSTIFNQTVKQELADFNNTDFPLHLATTQGGIVDNKQVSISVLNSIEKATNIEVKLAVFFDELVAGCSCGDQPMQVNNYCQLLLLINKQTSQATFLMLPDE